MDRLKRNLDGVYFRMGKEDICFSDLTEEEMEMVMENRDTEWLKSMCVILGKQLREVGDQFNLISE